MPPPRLITASPAELERRLAREVTTALARDPLARVAILVGGTLQRPYLRRRLAELGAGHLGVELWTGRERALALGDPAKAAGRPSLGPLAERALARLVAARARGPFARVAHGPGLAEALHRLAGELRGAGVTAAQLATADATPRRRDLARLLTALERARAHYWTVDDALASAQPARLDADVLLVHGVWQPSPALRRALGALAARLELVVLLPHSGSQGDDVHAPLRRWLQARGAQTHSIPPVGESNGAAGRQPALAHLQRALLTAHPGPPAPSDPSVRLVSAPDPGREVRAAVRACLRWAREGVPFADMAIVYRHEQPYRALAAATLREAGIPSYLDQGEPLLERPVGRRAATLLELVDGGLDRAAVMGLLADAALPDQAGEVAAGVAAARWDSLARRAGVIAGLEQWHERLVALRDGELAAADGEPERSRAQRTAQTIDALLAWVAELDECLRERPERATWTEQLGYLERLLSRYARDSAPLVTALGELRALELIEPEVTFARFRAVVLETLGRLRATDVGAAPSGGFQTRVVNVLSARSARGLSFRAVWVLGLADGDFPPPPRQDPLLLDAERASLNACQAWELPLRALGADPEPLGLHALVHAARERLVLSYPRTAAGDGRPALPSVFLRLAAQTLTGERVTVEALQAGAPRIAAHLDVLAAGRLSGARPEEALTPVEYDRTLLELEPELGFALVAARAPAIERARRAHHARWSHSVLTAWDGVVGAGEEALAERAGLTGALSPTALETYAQCPYRFFLGRVLGLQDHPEPDVLDRMEPLERGNLVHRVLERFLSGLGDGERPRRERGDEQLERLRAIAAEECAERERRGLTGHRALWRLDQRRLDDDLRRWWEMEADDDDARRFDHGAFELRFGPPRAGEGAVSPRSTDTPLCLDVGAQRPLRFAGRVDRVNWRDRPAAFRVIDYKTGKVRHKAEVLAGGRALQLPIYLLGAAHALGLPAEAGEAQYLYPTLRGGFSRVSFSGETLATRRGELNELLRGLAAGIGQGDFHPVPGARAANCRWCPFDAVCPSGRDEIAARKSDDPRVQAHAALGEIP